MKIIVERNKLDEIRKFGKCNICVPVHFSLSPFEHTTGYDMLRIPDKIWYGLHLRDLECFESPFALTPTKPMGHGMIFFPN